MKYVLTFIILVSTITGYSQNKYVKPIIIVDIPVQNITVAGHSANIGVLFGNENFVQIGILTGYSIYKDKNEITEQEFPTLSLMWRIPVKRVSVIPMFSYYNSKYQDLSIRVGYAITNTKATSIHLFGSTQMGYGIGTNIILK